MSYVIGAALIIVGALLIKHGWDKSMPKVIAGILALVLGISIVAVRATGAGCGSDDAYALAAPASSVLAKPAKPSKPGGGSGGSKGSKGLKGVGKAVIHGLYCS